MNYYTKNS